MQNPQLANWIQQHIEKTYHLEQVGFIPGMMMKGWLNIHKPINVIDWTNTMNGKSYMVISVHTQKMLDKIQHQSSW
jgi:hypothetical protein